MGRRTNTAVWFEKYKRWQIKVQKDGERRTFTSSTPGRTGQREANRKADEWLDDGVTNAVGHVWDAYVLFLEDQKMRGGTANYNNIDSIGRVWILPAYGNKKLDAVTEYDLQAVINKAQSKGLSRKTQRNILATQKSFFKFCRINKWTTLLPEGVNIPDSARYKSKRILQPHDLILLFNKDTIIERGKPVIEKYICAFRLAVMSGLRPGELRGLKWADVHENYIDIKRAINTLHEVTDGKNHNAIRRHWLTDMEKGVIDEQKELSPPDLCEYVFNISSTNGFRNRWKKFAALHGITVTTAYELRHTFVSITQAELPEGLVKSIVGHSKSMDTFGVYGHEVNGAGKKSAAAVGQVFNKILNDKDSE